MLKKRNFLLLTIGLLGSLLTFSVAFGLPYYPGETLDPVCAPGAASCFVRLIDPKDEGTSLLTGPTDTVQFFDFVGNGVTSSYADSTKTLTINVPGNSSASNGLSLLDDNIKLGGTLVQNTNINQDNFNLQFNNGLFSSVNEYGTNRSSFVHKNDGSGFDISAHSDFLNNFNNTSSYFNLNPNKVEIKSIAPGLHAPYSIVRLLTDRLFLGATDGINSANIINSSTSVALNTMGSRFVLNGFSGAPGSFILENSFSLTDFARIQSGLANNDLDISSSGILTISNPVGSTGSIDIKSAGPLSLSSPMSFEIKTPNVLSASAANGQILALVDSSVGQVEFTDFSDILSVKNGISWRTNEVVLGGVLDQITTIDQAGWNLNIINGNLGISNLAPSHRLHVGSSSAVSGTTVARFENAGGTCDVTPNISGGITCTSDINYKNNIEDINKQSVRTMINSLEIKSYNMMNDGNGQPKQIGFIAQNIETFFPSLVRRDINGKLSVSYAGMTPIIISTAAPAMTRSMA
jgi:hypothetical protein